MLHENAFLMALAITTASALLVTIYFHRALKKMLIQTCETYERADFWTALVDVILLITPILALLLARDNGSNRIASPVMLVADLMWAPLLGLVVALFLTALIVAAITTSEPTWESQVVPREHREDLKRLLAKMDRVRAREILVRDADDESKPGGNLP